MPFPKTSHDKSVLDTRALTLGQITSLFEQAESFRSSFIETGSFFASSTDPLRSTDASVAQGSGEGQISGLSRETKNKVGSRGGPRVVSCLFFEPSTRTRMSFEMAAYRLGHQVQLMDSSASSSLSKGESFGDTVLNVLAMNPDALVIRYGNSQELDELLPTLKIPVLNAGSGVAAHPSQALLDALTIRQKVRASGAQVNPANLRSLEGQKVLIVGDVRHSRVASSNFDVLTRLGAKVAVCGPKEFLPEAGTLPSEIEVMQNLDEATAWADVYMALRIQLERHGGSKSDAKGNEKSNSIETKLGDYNSQFGLNPHRLQILKKDAIIMHPGPINHGVELSIEAIQDPRARIMNQVENGVYIRAALLARALN